MAAQLVPPPRSSYNFITTKRPAVGANSSDPTAAGPPLAPRASAAALDARPLLRAPSVPVTQASGKPAPAPAAPASKKDDPSPPTPAAKGVSSTAPTNATAPATSGTGQLAAAAVMKKRKLPPTPPKDRVPVDRRKLVGKQQRSTKSEIQKKALSQMIAKAARKAYFDASLDALAMRVAIDGDKVLVQASSVTNVDQDADVDNSRKKTWNDLLNVLQSAASSVKMRETARDAIQGAVAFQLARYCGNVHSSSKAGQPAASAGLDKQRTAAIDLLHAERATIDGVQAYQQTPAEQLESQRLRQLEAQISALTRNLAGAGGKKVPDDVRKAERAKLIAEQEQILNGTWRQKQFEEPGVPDTQAFFAFLKRHAPAYEPSETMVQLLHSDPLTWFNVSESVRIIADAARSQASDDKAKEKATQADAKQSKKPKKEGVAEKRKRSASDADEGFFQPPQQTTAPEAPAEEDGDKELKEQHEQKKQKKQKKPKEQDKDTKKKIKVKKEKQSEADDNDKDDEPKKQKEKSQKKSKKTKTDASADKKDAKPKSKKAQKAKKEESSSSEEDSLSAASSDEEASN